MERRVFGRTGMEFGILGFGCGISFNPMLLAAMSDVPPDESGLASGVVNTAFMMGGALGLAVGITGNLPTDGTALALFLDTVPGGQDSLDTVSFPTPPSGVPQVTGLGLDAGFAPDRMLWVNLYGGTLFTAFAFNWVFNWWVLDALAGGLVPDHSVLLAVDCCFLLIFAAMTYGFGFLLDRNFGNDVFGPPPENNPFN